MLTQKYTLRWVLTLVLGVHLAQSVTLSRLIYVDDSAIGLNNGNNWNDAFTDLYDALIKARPGDEIRVAQGIYRPTVPNGDREEAFFLSQAQGAKIKGGYAGYGTPNPDARDISAYETILSGDLNGDDEPNFTNNDENCYHVLDGSGTDELTVLDGFTITGGNANGIRWRELNGGGIWNMGGSLTIIDCTFVRNSTENCGGGMFNSASGDPTPIPSKPTLKGCRFIENSAKNGGGMFNVGSEPILLSCTFSGNLSSHGAGVYNDHSCTIIINCNFTANMSSYGGGVFNYLSCPELTNCVFNANSARWGGGMLNYDNSPVLINCTFSRNEADVGGGTYNVDANPIFTNCIFWCNSDSSGTDETAQIYMVNGVPIVNYSCVQGWTGIWGGKGNTYLDPLFIDEDGDDEVVGTEDDNLRLLWDSPCIDAGDNNSVPPDVLDLDDDDDANEPVPFDYDYNPRFANANVDMGAFEFSDPGLHEVIYVDADAKGANDGTSWRDAFPNLQDALWIAAMDPGVREIRVAQGLYRPAPTNGRRDATFQLKNALQIKGGYAGFGEPDPNAWDPELYETILSGDLNGNDAIMADPCDYLTDPNRFENSYHVVTGSGTNGTAILDGFIIMGGIANGIYDEDGGGIYIMVGNPTIRQCTLLGNAAQGDGGGIYCLFSDPNIRECTISENSAEFGAGIYCLGSCPNITKSMIVANYAISDGGGICCGYQSCPAITHNKIMSNRADQYGGGICCIDGSLPNILYNNIQGNCAFDGGGIYCFYSDSNISNNIITDNIASDDGGGIACINSSGTEIRNNTLVGNKANPQGGGIFCEDLVPMITNCILWNNGDDLHAYTKSPAGLACYPTFCCIEDGDPGLGNISWAPYFVDSANGDYHLMPYSLCIDAGDPNSDYSLEPLRNGNRINIGAYGNTPEAATKSEDSDYDGIPDDWEIEHFSALTQPDLDIDGDDATNLQEYLAGTNPHLAYEGLLETVYVSSANAGDPLADGSYAHPFASIQQGIDAARDGGQILVTTGTFYEFLVIDGKILDIIGGYDLNFTGIHDFTTLSGQSKGRPVLYVNTPDGLFRGFIITDGFERDGSGMYIFNSSPEITNNIIKHNTSWDDAAIYCYYNSAPLLRFNTIIDNNAHDAAGGIYLRESAATLWSCIIIGNKASEAGGIRITNSKPSLYDTIIIHNEVKDKAGGIYCDIGSELMIHDCTISYNNAEHGDGGGILSIKDSSLAITDCVIQGNTPDGIWINKGSAKIGGKVQLISNNFIGRDLQIIGYGQLQTSSDVLLKMDNCTISCNLTGAATVQVELNSELTIQDHADINLAGGGMIRCDGLLRVKDNSRISNTIIEVSRASFEGDADIFNNVITAGIGSPYGQFFIEGTVAIIGNKIYADGDRFIDYDPSGFGGFIADDEIHVTITEGIHGTRGGLLELRGKDILDPNYYQCHPDTHICQVDPCEFPGFDQNTWMLEELVLNAGAKLNLTNRFDFQPPFDYGGDYEVLYVKRLILGPNSVLNTAYNRIYYQTLEMDHTAKITCEPLLGFSLNMITFDEETEFLTRIRHNNFTDPDNPDFNRIHVERVEDLEPDPNGMMQMRNLMDGDPESPDYGQVLNARVKGLFAKSNEDKILIRFEYMFDTFDPNVELVIYLTDVPELLKYDDPNRGQHYVKVAHLQVPPEGRPGSPESKRFGVFHQYVWKCDLDFIKGTRIELELVGPHGSCVLINNWDPQVHCSDLYCGDVTGEHGVTPLDILTVLAYVGSETELAPGSVVSLVCLEFPWIADGVVDASDVSVWDWVLSEDSIYTLCDIPLVLEGESTSTTASSFGYSDSSGLFSSSAGYPPPDTLLITGKKGTFQDAKKVEDCLYVFDADAQYLDKFDPEFNRANGKLVKDFQGQPYQINLKRGLVRLSEDECIVPQGNVIVNTEPRYNTTNAEVRIGFGNQENEWMGRPIFDAAFSVDPCHIYVVPVVVNPNDGDPNTAYLAAARLQLDPNLTPPYRVVQLYDDPPLPGDNQHLNNLREIEVDSTGKLYVLNRGALNECDILLVYDTKTAAVLSRIELGNPAGNTYLPAPSAMYLSEQSGMLYLASSRNDPNAGSVVLYALSTKDFTLAEVADINDIGHITDVTGDNTTGTVWVVGFTMYGIFDDPNIPLTENVEPFYKPYIAKIPSGSGRTVQAKCLSDPILYPDNDLALPLSIVWTGPKDKCVKADVDDSGKVNLMDFTALALYWLEANCGLCGGADFTNDGNVDLNDLNTFCDCWLWELKRNLNVELNINNLWMYQNLPGAAGSNLTANVVVTDDPLNNSSYSYQWELVLPSDVSLEPETLSGGGSRDSFWSFMARNCHQPEAMSDSGQVFRIIVTVRGNDHGNTGTAEQEFGIALLGDVNNDCRVDVADRSIINALWMTGPIGIFTLRDCDLNCDGVLDIADRSITNAIWRGTLCSNEVTSPCPFR